MCALNCNHIIRGGEERDHYQQRSNFPQIPEALLCGTVEDVDEEEEEVVGPVTAQRIRESCNGCTCPRNHLLFVNDRMNIKLNQLISLRPTR